MRPSQSHPWSAIRAGVAADISGMVAQKGTPKNRHRSPGKTGEPGGLRILAKNGQKLTLPCDGVNSGWIETREVANFPTRRTAEGGGRLRAEHKRPEEGHRPPPRHPSLVFGKELPC